MNSKKRNIKKNNITQLILGVLIIILLNIISSFVFTRFDLTTEKRYSLSPATKKLLRNLDDVVFFKVYLEGELPAGFRRLSNETREMLDEFRAYSRNIQFEFVNPSSSADAKERTDTYKLLVERGLQPTDLRMNEKGGSSRLIIFPGSIVTYRGKEMPVQLLMTQMGQDPNKVLNNSIQGLEYNLASAIGKLTQIMKPSVAFIEGEGELNGSETYDISRALSEFYSVDRVTIGHKIKSLAIRLTHDSLHPDLVNKYKVIIIARPLSAFDEKDKFLIDQFIMRGGRVLWLIDAVFASMDSLQKYTSTMGIPVSLNLEDMLFHWGARINTNLVMDISALPIPVKTGQVGDQPQFEFFPWYYFPVITPVVSHPVVNGLNAIKTEFISSIDTVEAPGIRKTILLTSSPYSRLVTAPVYITLDILRQKPDERMYDKGPQPVAVLLEGTFTSTYQFRIPPSLESSKDLGFLEKSKTPTKMIIAGDGDIIKNQFHFKQGYPMPLGYDQYTRETFGNKDFIMNCINYLCDDSGLISVRSRELRLRLLDNTRLGKERLLWQMLNVIVPILLVCGFGLVKYRLRKRKYGRPAELRAG